MGNPDYPLEPSPAAMRTMLQQASERVVEHIETLPEQPASYTSDGRAEARALAEPLPESGTDLEDLLDLIFDRAVPVSYNTAAPGYLAYIPGGGLFPAALADLIANAVNRYVGVWAAAPALVQLELNVVRWFCDIVGYPAGSGGILTTGGSLATFTAVVTARQERLGEDFGGGTIYASDQAHHAVLKAAVLAGFPAQNVRTVPTDERFQMRLDELNRLIAQDHDAGLRPFLVVANGGTTNTGAIDDLERTADLCEQNALWMHVDAAYGGFFMLTERGQRVLRGLERASSVGLNPHKGLFLPYGNGALLVRDAETLRRSHSTFADYMPPMQDDSDLVDFCEISPELSRDFRGLRVWLPIKMFGIDAFRASLDEKLDLTEWATEQLQTIPDVEILAAPRLSIVAFGLTLPGLSQDELNELNRRLIERINARQNVMLTGTMLRGRFVLRICVLSFRTHRDRMEQCLDDIRAACSEVAPGPAGPATSPRTTGS